MTYKQIIYFFNNKIYDQKELHSIFKMAVNRRAKF